LLARSLQPFSLTHYGRNCHKPHNTSQHNSWSWTLNSDSLHTKTRAALSSPPDLWDSTQPWLWMDICLYPPGEPSVHHLQTVINTTTTTTLRWITNITQSRSARSYVTPFGMVLGLCLNIPCSHVIDIASCQLPRSLCGFKSPNTNYNWTWYQFS